MITKIINTELYFSIIGKKNWWKFWNVQLLRLCWNQVLSCGAFDVLHVIHFFHVPDKGSGVLICSKWQASQNPDVKWYTTYVSKGLECSQESNGFFSFSDYFFSYMVIVVSLITSVIHLCGCDLVSSLVKQNCFKL